MITRPLITYSGFAIAFIGVILAFITATTYTHLIIAILLYPLLIFFAYKIFPIRSQNFDSGERLTQGRLQGLSYKVTKPIEIDDTVSKKQFSVNDIDKRSFLKLIGATGISFFLISIFGRKVESLLLNDQNLVQSPSFIGDMPVNKTSAVSTSPTDAYNISEIDEGAVSFYGFINKDGGWFIMKGDTDTGSFRYVKGDSDFPGNWNNRENLKYDYFHEVFF